MQGIGHVVADDLAGQTLCDGRFTHPGLADQHRVILGAPGQRLHHLANFLLAAHHRIQLADAGQFCEVNAVLLQGAVALLGVGVIDPVGAAQFLHRLIDHLLVDAQVLEQAGGIAGVFPGGGNQQVLHADELVAQTLCLFIRHLEHALQPRRDEDLLGASGHFRHTFQRLVQPAFDLLGVHAQLPQDAFGQAIFQSYQRQHHMLHVPLGVLVVPQQFLRTL